MHRLLPLLLALILSTLSAEPQETPPAELVMPSTPGAGDGDRLGYLISQDAKALEAAQPQLCLDFEASEAALQKGDLVLACAIALHSKETAKNKPELARAQARLALVLVTAGDLAGGLAEANEVLPSVEQHAEIFLARATALFRAGRFVEARENLSKAEAAKPAAPAWAMTAWEKELDARAVQIAALEKATEPDDSASPEYLNHAELALAAGAFSKADRLSSIAISSLIQERMVNPSAPPDLLRRAWQCKRDALLSLCARACRPEAVNTWAHLCTIARAACGNKAGRADWETYLGLLAKARDGMPLFDFSSFNLHQDLLEAEKAGASPKLREGFKDLLAQPRLRYASRLHTTLERYEALPEYDLVLVPSEGDIPAEDREGLLRLADFLEKEESAAAGLRALLPPGLTPVQPEPLYQETLARVRFITALLRSDPQSAKAQVDVLKALSASSYIFDLEKCQGALARLQEKAFPALVAEFDRLPTSELAKAGLGKAIVDALLIDNALQKAHGRDHEAKTGLPEEARLLQRSLRHLRLLAACEAGHLLGAERHLASLELLCAPGRGPAYAPLDSCIQRVKTLVPDPEGIPELRDAYAEARAARVSNQQLERLAEFVDVPEGEEAGDELAEGLLRAIVWLRKGWVDEAGEELSKLRGEIHHNTWAVEYMNRIEADYAPENVLGRALEAYRSGDAGRRKAAAGELMVLGARYLEAIKEKKGQDLFAHAERLSPAQTRLMTDSSLAISLAASCGGDLLTASAYLRPLQVLKADASLKEAVAALAELPLKADLPDETARQLWNDLPRIDTLPQDRLKLYAATLQKGKGDSLGLRFAETYWRLKLLRWDQASQLLSEQKALLGGNKACREVLDLFGTTLQACRSLHESTKRELDEIKGERRKYYNDYRSTVARLNEESERKHQQNEEIVRQVKAIEVAMNEGQLSYSDAISQLERLEALHSGGPNEVYKQRDRQRSLDFLEEAKRKIAAYDSQLKELETRYHGGLQSHMTSLHREISGRLQVN